MWVPVINVALPGFHRFPLRFRVYQLGHEVECFSILVHIMHSAHRDVICGEKYQLWLSKMTTLIMCLVNLEPGSIRPCQQGVTRTLSSILYCERRHEIMTRPEVGATEVCIIFKIVTRYIALFFHHFLLQ